MTTSESFNNDSPMFKVNGQEYRADNVLGVKQISENEVEVRYPRMTITLENTTTSAVMSAIEKAKSKRR